MNSRVLIAALIGFSLSACAGRVGGMVHCQQIEAPQSQMLRMRGFGLSVANDPVDRSMTIGWADRTYLFAKAFEKARNIEAESGFFRGQTSQWGLCRWPDGAGAPQFIDGRAMGIHVSFGAPVVGLTLGLNTWMNMAPVGRGQTIVRSLRYDRRFPERSLLRYCEGAQCGSLP